MREGDLLGHPSEFSTEGAELAHVVVYLDVPNVKAAAYTAMSRVQYMRDCLIGGHVKQEHFRPAA